MVSNTLITGKPHGYGQYSWVVGSTYVGYFYKGLKHGKGVWRDKEQPLTNLYRGEYKWDKKHGNGLYKWESGNDYEGEYKEDERDGFGIFMWKDGSKYIGNWVKGV